jgi:hypothetical protein
MNLNLGPENPTSPPPIPNSFLKNFNLINKNFLFEGGVIGGDCDDHRTDCEAKADYCMLEVLE